MQSTKPAGGAFYQLIKSIFNKVGINPTSFDTGFYVFVYQERHFVFLVIETDNFLLATSCTEAYIKVHDEVKKAFRDSLQTGLFLNYLNFQIYQSKFGISIDQTAHVLQMLDNLFGRDTSIAQMDTPL